MAWLDLEAANTWAAVETLLAAEPEQALLFAADLVPYWATRGQMNECRRWLQRALPRQPGRTVGRARALAELGMLENMGSGNLDVGESILQEAIELASELGEDRIVAFALTALAWSYGQRGDSARGVRFGREALAVADHAGEPRLAAKAKSMLALALAALGEYDEALSLMRESREVLEREAGQPQNAALLINLSMVEIQQGDYRNARRSAQSGLDICLQAGLESYGIVALTHLAFVSLVEGRIDDSLTESMVWSPSSSRSKSGATSGRSRT